MPRPKSKTAAADALVGLWTVALTAFVIAALYFARDLLIPLALSALLTFLFSPLVGRLERWIGRIAAVLFVVVLIFTATGATGWMLTRQLVDLATKFATWITSVSTQQLISDFGRDKFGQSLFYPSSAAWKAAHQ